MLSLQKLATAAAIALILSGTALANQSANVATPGATSATPLQMRFFCASNPRECIATRAAKAPFSDELFAMLHRVNTQVNAAIQPLANPRGGWKINPRSGDCNDYALTKRSRLIGMGVPAGALRLAVTVTPTAQKHLILIVKTTSGDLVLDNLATTVKTLRESGYPIQALSGANPIRWTAG